MSGWRIIIGRAEVELPKLADGSVHCCVTSPPYWGLRDYGCEGQLGLEATPEEYIARMVAVFREVRRVLRNDGTAWVNIGDCYSGSGRGGYPGDKTRLGGGTDGQDQSRKAKRLMLHDRTVRNGAIGRASTPVPPGLKPKDLVGMPWRLAFALQADGWWLRNDIIWHKPSVTPESACDRATRDHEYLFLLTKRRRYWFNAAAIEEPVAEATRKDRVDGCRFRPPRGYVGSPSCGGGRLGSGETRNKRTVWTIPSQRFAEAHFATYPEALVEPCVLAGCPEGGTVLDPFTGSGTTGAVACRLGRNFVGVELNPEYAAMAERRIKRALRPHTARSDNVGHTPLFEGGDSQEAKS